MAVISKALSSPSVKAAISKALSTAKTGASSIKSTTNKNTVNKTETAKATLPDGTTTTVTIVNGKTQTSLPAGSVVHTGGQSYQITGGTAGNYQSTNVTGSTNPLTNKDTQPVTTKDTTKTAQTGGFPYEKMLTDMLAQLSKYKAPSNKDLLSQAETYARLQTDPVLADITNKLNTARTSAASQKGEVEAAYENLAALTQARLNEARKYAVESAISRNMGRSGVTDWLINEQTTPIMLEEQQAGAEKVARLNSIANELANTEAEIERLRTQTEQRRGDLQTQQYTTLQQLSQQQIAEQQARDWQMITDLSNLGMDWQTIQNALAGNFQW